MSSEENSNMFDASCSNSLPSLYGSIQNGDPNTLDDNEYEPTVVSTTRLTLTPNSSFDEEVGAGRTIKRPEGLLMTRSRSRSLSSSLLMAVGQSFRLSGKPCSVRDLGGTATIPNEVFNLIKNIVGCGVLTLPTGVAAFGNAPSALIPAAAWIVFMGVIFAYYFLLLGRICKMTVSATYREAWEETLGDTGSAIVTLFNIIDPGMGNLAYSMILADTFSSLFSTIGFKLSRTESLLAVTMVALLPLCLLKNLNMLAPFSIMGTAGITFTAIVMGVRYFDGSYDPSNETAVFLEDIPDYYKPSFGSKGANGAFSANVLILVCMVFGAYVAHYNAPRYYVELKRSNIRRFSAVVGYSFSASATLYIVIAAFGFLTFGESSSGFILNNYSNKDGLATASRISIAVAIIFTYPLAFIGVRDGVLDLFMVPSIRQTSSNLNLLSVILLVFITVLAVYIEDLGLVNAVGSGITATAIVFVFPSLMFRSAVHQLGKKASISQKWELKFAIGLMWVGIFMGVVGVIVALRWGAQFE